MSSIVRKNILFCGVLSLMLFAACKERAEKVTEIETQQVMFVDSTKYAHVAISGEFPIANDQITTHICDSLFALLDDCLGNPDYADQRSIAPYAGTSRDWDSIVVYYGRAILEQMTAYSKTDEADRLAYASNDDAAAYDDYFPRWEFQMEVKKICQQQNYVVFSCNDYVYMGGAHGGSGGLGDIVFDLRDGSHFTNFFVPNVVQPMQPLLRRGLISYFSADMDPITDSELNDNLMLEGDEIPLPVAAPSPTEEGLTFVYGQYEIACYAAGMPSFTIPYQDLLPYLTDEAKDLLNLNDAHE